MGNWGVNNLIVAVIERDGLQSESIIDLFVSTEFIEHFR